MTCACAGEASKMKMLISKWIIALTPQAASCAKIQIVGGAIAMAAVFASPGRHGVTRIHLSHAPMYDAQNVRGVVLRSLPALEAAM
jgi:hypothetical protein